VNNTTITTNTQLFLSPISEPYFCINPAKIKLKGLFSSINQDPMQSQNDALWNRKQQAAQERKGQESKDIKVTTS
jgi:hypothetical protein